MRTRSSTASRAFSSTWTTFPARSGRVLANEVLRNRLAKGALSRARWFTWDATARRALEALATQAREMPQD